MAKNPLAIFTFSYPYGGETTFLQNEVKFLAQQFAPLILIPRNIKGDRDNLPKGVIVDESYSKWMQRACNKVNKIFTAAATKLVGVEFSENIVHMIHPGNISRMFSTLYDVQLTRKWLEDVLAVNKYPGLNLFYTYWLGKATLGIGIARARYPKICVVSRVHRGDLYARNQKNQYMPCQGLAIKAADRVFAVSNDGRAYIESKYSWAKNIEVARLGVEQPINRASKSVDGVFRIVTCSALRPVKRVELLAKGLCRAAEIRPEQLFQWDHFGDGETRFMVENETRKFPSNIHSHLWGQVDNNTLLKYYSSNPVDLFVNTSSSEGVPVSIMEAFSYGVPVLATSVGGTPEIITGDCGWLLPETSDERDIAEATLNCVDHPDDMDQKREAAHLMWQTHYNSIQNYSRFAQKLQQLAL